MRRALIGFLVLLLIPGALPAPRISAQDDVWTAVRNVPQGSRVRVTLRENGTNITGTLVELREDAIVMKNNAADRAFLFPSGSRLRDAVPFGRADVTGAALVEIARSYRRSDPPNTAILRRVASEFAGQRETTLQVRYTINNVNITTKGTIDEVGAESLAIRAGRKRVVRIPYASVVSLQREPFTSTALWKTTVVTGSIIGGLMISCAVALCSQ